MQVNSRGSRLLQSRRVNREAGMSEAHSVVLFAAMGALVVFSVALIAASNYANRIPRAPDQHRTGPEPRD